MGDSPVSPARLGGNIAAQSRALLVNRHRQISAPQARHDGLLHRQCEASHFTDGVKNRVWFVR